VPHYRAANSATDYKTYLRAYRGAPSQVHHD
jgi:hypothetical protein